MTDSWVALTFGKGVVYADGLVSLENQSGEAIAVVQASNRWGASPTRLVRIQPQEELVPGGWYTARLLPGAVTLDGEQTTQPHSVTFQVACRRAGDPACPDEGELPEADIDGPAPRRGDTAADTAARTDAAAAAPTPECGCAAPARPRTAALLGLPLVGLLVRRRIGER